MIATSKKTRQGLKLIFAMRLKTSGHLAIATSKKTRQGLKQACNDTEQYNAAIATSKKTRQGLKLT